MEIAKSAIFGSRANNYGNKRRETTVSRPHRCNKRVARPCPICKGNRTHSTKVRVRLKDED